MPMGVVRIREFRHCRGPEYRGTDGERDICTAGSTVERGLLVILRTSCFRECAVKAVFVAALALLGLICGQRAAAQASSPVSHPPKPELLATSKDAQPSPSQGAAPAVRAAASAGKTVAERQAETLEAVRKRQLVPAGHGSPGGGQ